METKKGWLPAERRGDREEKGGGAISQESFIHPYRK
jgi:hypothetical protein